VNFARSLACVDKSVAGMGPTIVVVFGESEPTPANTPVWMNDDLDWKFFFIGFLSPVNYPLLTYVVYLMLYYLSLTTILFFFLILLFPTNFLLTDQMIQLMHTWWPLKRCEKNQYIIQE